MVVNSTCTAIQPAAYLRFVLGRFSGDAFRVRAVVGHVPGGFAGADAKRRRRDVHGARVASVTAQGHRNRGLRALRRRTIYNNYGQLSMVSDLRKAAFTTHINTLYLLVYAVWFFVYGEQTIAKHTSYTSNFSCTYEYRFERTRICLKKWNIFANSNSSAFCVMNVEWWITHTSVVMGDRSVSLETVIHFRNLKL